MDPKTIAERQAREEKQAAETLATKRHEESLAKMDALANSNLQIMRSFVAYLNKRVSKTEVTNQLKSIATPDALKVVEIIKKLDKTVQDKKVDWKPMQEALKPISEALGQLANKKDPDPIDIPEIDYQKIADSFGAAIAKLAAPVVNLPAPIVKVPKADAPIINTEKVDLKPFVNEVLQVLTDFRIWTQDQVEEDPVIWSELKELTEKQNKLLEKIEKKKFGGGGGSGGGGYVFKQAGITGRPLVAPDAIASSVDPTIIGIVALNADGTPIGGSGGGGGAVTIADGADVAQGARADAAYTSGSGTIVSILKGIFAKAAALLTGQSDGNQKSQIVDAGGEAATVTGGKLDVNASVDTTGLALSANQTNRSQKSQITDGTDEMPIGAMLYASGVTSTTGATLLAVAPGFKIRLYHVSYVPTSSASSDIDVTVLIGANVINGWRTNFNGGGYMRSPKGGMGWWEGADGEDVTITLSGAQPVRWNLEYDIVAA